MRQRKLQEGERTYVEALSNKNKPTINQIEIDKLRSDLQR
jgi:hypothetical protein